MPLSKVYPRGERERRRGAPGDYRLTAYSPRSNPCYGPAGAKWSEVCRTLAQKGCDTGVPARFDGAMDVTCPEYGHGLRAEKIPAGAVFDSHAPNSPSSARTQTPARIGFYVSLGSPSAARFVRWRELLCGRSGPKCAHSARPVASSLVLEDAVWVYMW